VRLQGDFEVEQMFLTSISIAQIARIFHQLRNVEVASIQLDRSASGPKYEFEMSQDAGAAGPAAAEPGGAGSRLNPIRI
jgi:hypothetical protein